VGEHETQLFELPPELSDPQKTPCVNVPEWFVREGGELCLSESGNGTSVIRWDCIASLFRIRSSWASRIRIRNYLYGSGSSHQINKQKILEEPDFQLFCDFLMTFLSMKTAVNVPTVRNKQKKVKEAYFLLAS
jgi:hypothetical protein